VYVTGMTTSKAAWLTVPARSGQTGQRWVDSLWPAAEQAAQLRQL
jgi:hypothetical protein